MSQEQEEKVRQALKRLTKQKAQSRLCKVIAIDESKETVDVQPLDEGPEMFDVRINAVPDLGKKGIAIMPERDSLVLVSLIANNENDAYISLATEVKWVRIGGDQYGGLVKSESVADRLNAIEDKVLALIVDVAALASPLGLSATMTSVQQPLLTKTNKSQLENEKIKHG